MPICGAKNKDGSQCQAKVSTAGDHCYRHSPRLWRKIKVACEAITLITGTAQGVVWLYQVAAPHMLPIWLAVSPERFWQDGVAAFQGRPAEVVHRELKRALRDVIKRHEYLEQKLAGLPDSEREKISAAYDDLIAKIEQDYPGALQTASENTA